MNCSRIGRERRKLPPRICVCGGASTHVSMVVVHGNCGYNAKAKRAVGNREARKLISRSAWCLLSYFTLRYLLTFECDENVGVERESQRELIGTGLSKHC